MKTLGLAVAMLMAGYLLGGWGPRGTVRELRDELKTSREQLAKEKKGGRTAFGGVTRMLNIEEVPARAAVHPQEPSADQPVEIVSVSSNSPQDAAEEPGAPAENEPAVVAHTERDPAKFKKNLETAADAWALRADLARNSFVEKAGLDRDQAAQVDVLMDAMNLRIAAVVERYVQQVRDSKEEVQVGEEFGIRLMRDMSDAMVLTYDEMDRHLPAGWREQTAGSFKLTDMIDPMVAMPLVEIEDRVRMD